MVDSTTEEAIPEFVINDAVRSYEPRLEDQFFTLESGDYQRLIFINQKLRDKEENHLNDFRNFLKVKNLTLPAGYDDENRLVVRLLQKMHWDYQKTYDQINLHSQWLKNCNISNIEPVRPWLEQGFMYGYMRDKSLRPIIIVNVRKLADSKISIDQIVETADFFLHYVIKNGMSPGRVENFVCIFDMRNVGVTELPTKHIQNRVKSMSKNYCGRMFKFFATDCNWLVRSMMWTVH